jgi:hypothetical protein
MYPTSTTTPFGGVATRSITFEFTLTLSCSYSCAVTDSVGHSSLLVIQNNPDPSWKWGCCQQSATISVNFPSNFTPEPVTLYVSGLPSGATFSWGNELPASSLAPYTATPPYTVNLGIYTTPSTPLYGINTPPDTITILATSSNSYPVQATITLYVDWCQMLQPGTDLYACHCKWGWNQNRFATVSCTSAEQQIT